MIESTARDERELLARIETYLDAVPLSAADPEPAGKFTLYRPRGPWPYYARPRLGLEQQIDAADVVALRARQDELKLPNSIEWVLETTPTLADAAEAAGLAVVRYPLLVLDRVEQALAAATHLTDGISMRRVDADDPDFARAHAVAHVGFGAAGTAVGPHGGAERDQAAAATKPAVLDFMRSRARDGVSISYAAFDDDGPISVGTHQPVDGVSEVVGVATLPAARRRGVAAAVTAALVRDALARGVTTVFLSAGSDDVARVYERVGFRRIGHAGAAEPPEAASH